MSVAHVVSTGFAGGETTSGNIVLSGLVALGHDLYFSLLSSGHSSSIAFPTVTDNDVGGNLWTRIGSTGTRKGGLWWKKATAGSAGKTVSVTGGVTELTGGVTAYSGGDAGNPTTNWATEENASSDELEAGFTPDNANSMICLTVFNHVNPHAVTLMACTAPGALTQRLEELGVGSSTSHGSAPQVGGPTATGNFTWVQSNQATKSMVWAIKPLLTTGGGLAVKSRITAVLNAVHQASNW